VGLKEELAEAGLLDLSARMGELAELEIAKSEKRKGFSGQITGSIIQDYWQVEAAYKEVITRPQEEAARKEGAGGGEDSLAFSKVA